MVSCQKCDFKILPKMRFSLIKNFCPSCGGSLLSELDSQEINSINRKLQSQEFMISLSNQLSKDLIQNLIYDLSIFFKFDLQKEYSRQTVPDLGQTDLNNDNSDASLATEEEEGNSDESTASKRFFKPISRAGDSSTKNSIANLRRALERREEEDESDDEDFTSDDEDVDERVKRLKAAYQNSPTLKKFKGIIRADES